MAFLSLFGFTSSWMRRRNLIVAYKVRLVAYMLIILICGPGVLAPLYVAPEIFGFCGFESADQTTIGACKPGIRVSKGWILVIFIITWLLEIYTYIIVANYVDQLDQGETGDTVEPQSPTKPSQEFAVDALTQAVQSYGEYEIDDCMA